MICTTDNIENFIFHALYIILQLYSTRVSCIHSILSKYWFMKYLILVTYIFKIQKSLKFKVAQPVDTVSAKRDYSRF